MTTPAKPLRIQLKRIKGWRMPPNSISVARPGQWGNRYVIGKTIEHVDGITYTVADRAHAVKLYREWLQYQQHHFHMIDHLPGDIGGKNLACWCPLDQPCHADVLLELANK